MRPSKTLSRLAEQDDRVAEYEYNPANDFGAHWVHLIWPWVSDDGGSVHEKTVSDCLEQMKRIRPDPTLCIRSMDAAREIGCNSACIYMAISEGAIRHVKHRLAFYVFREDMGKIRDYIEQRKAKYD